MKTLLALLSLTAFISYSMAAEKECSFGVAKNTETITTSTNMINDVPRVSYVWGIDNEAESYLNENGFKLASDFNQADIKVFIQFDHASTRITKDVNYIHDKVLTMSVYKGNDLVMRRAISGFLTNNSYKKLLKQINKDQLSCE